MKALRSEGGPELDLAIELSFGNEVEDGPEGWPHRQWWGGEDLARLELQR